MRTAMKMEDAYLANPECCPFCASTNIDASAQVNFEDKQAWRQVACNDCNKEWIEEFGLVGVTFNIDDLKPEQL